MRLWVLGLLLAVLFPSRAAACACGCGIFGVQTEGMLPTEPGGQGYLEFDYMDQDRNWSGSSAAPSSGNDDKGIRSAFVTAGLRWNFDKTWGLSLQLPFWDRSYTTAESGTLENFKASSLGDIRVGGVYTGFFDDMSTGLSLGLKLPTGRDDAPGFDRDTAVGSGSTDLLLGAYRMAALSPTRRWVGFGRAQWDLPVLTSGGFRPGAELDLAAGLYYDDLYLGEVKLAPLAQVLGVYRRSDSGPAAAPADSGHRRVLLSPGLEAVWGPFRLNLSAAFPVYDWVEGSQLVAKSHYKSSVSWAF